MELPRNNKNQLHGYVKHYWNDNLIWEGNFTNGKRDGVFVEYYWNGNPHKIVRHTLGKKHQYSIIYHNGKVNKYFYI